MRFQVIVRAALLSALFLCLRPGPAEAGGRLRTLVYRGCGQGKVVFDHQLHASQGFGCNDCHTDFAGTGKQLFATRRQGLITFVDHTEGAQCFACHNAGGASAGHGVAAHDGKGAFYDCDRCHRKTGGF